ncbi:hypothetical protein RAO16_06005, partial [Limosilactobacillus reuteri]
TVTPLKTLMGFSVHLNVQLKFYNLPLLNDEKKYRQMELAEVPFGDGHASEKILKIVEKYLSQQ